jgi:fluoride ion exporter CrcB/FEX
MESPLTMQVHGALAGIASYVVMTQLLQQSTQTAIARSALIANATAAYMIMFGHKLPF